MKIQTLVLLSLLPLLTFAETLRSAFAPAFKVGAAINARAYVHGESPVGKLVAREFSSITAENEMKPMSLQPREGEFRWETADKFVAFGERHGMKIIGHCLVWHSQTPDWFFTNPDGSKATREQLIDRMRTHIHAVVGRYKGRVHGWDVVNEAFDDRGNLHPSPWKDGIGDDFIELAFRFAHEADPDAELYYNDFNMFTSGKRKGVVRLVRDLKAKGVRIDAVGLQSHAHVSSPAVADYEATIVALGEAGVKAMITELDVSVLPSAWGHTAEISANHAYAAKFDPWRDGVLPDEKQQELARRYAALFRMYLKHRDLIDRVTFWGVSDRDSWLNGFPVRGRTDYPLLFDRRLAPKPCYEAVLRTVTERPPVATFRGFSCRGEEKLPPCDPATEYRNPIMVGMAPDPSITRKGDDFYLANSSFSYYPGIPVYHSKNLVDWDFCGYIGDTVSKLRFHKGLGLSAGVFAPDIKYNPYNDTFYLIVTVIGDRGNVVYKSKDPYRGWSEPIKVPVGGIDPSFFFEDDKTAWILNNDDAPDGKAEYPGHRTVRMRKYDLVKDECVPGTERIIINKGIRPEEKPIWCEGPHLYKIDGRYYVMTAEGGTAGWHSEVMWSSDAVEGPYKPCKVNPILTQRDLPGDRPEPITAAGHADLFQTPGGDWMAVFLAIDPYKKGNRDMCNTGRSTFLLPVKWIGEGADRQPVILDQGKVVPRVVAKTDWMKNRGSGVPAACTKTNPPIPLAGNVVYTDDFTTSALDCGWFSLRCPSTFATCGDGLRLEATDDDLDSTGTPAYLCRWVRNKDFTTEIAVAFEPRSERDLAGLAYYQNETCHYEIAKTLRNGRASVVLLKTDKGKRETVAESALTQPGALKVRLVSRGKDVSFFYAEAGADWQPLGGVQDASILSTDHAGGFVAATIGPFVVAK